MEVIKFSEDVIVYRLKYNWTYTKESFLSRLSENDKLVTKSDLNTKKLLLNCPEFNDIKNITRNKCRELSNVNGEKFFETMWVYVQDPEHYIEGFHDHVLIGDFNLTVKNEWTYCFYLQIPPKETLKGDEGKLLFKDSDDKIYKFSPEEGDIIIFRYDIPHCPKLTPNAEIDRISICGNITFKMENNSDYKGFRR